MTWVVPDSNISWQGIYHYQFVSIGLVQNDKNPSTATDRRELFVQKTDLAKGEEKQYHVGGGIFDNRLEWEEPVNDERAPGLESLLRRLAENGNGSRPTHNITRNYFLHSLTEPMFSITRKGKRGRTGISIVGEPGVRGPQGARGAPGRNGVSIEGAPGLRGPQGAKGGPGQIGSVVAGLGLNNIEFHSNQFVQHRTTRISRPVVIIQQPTFIFQKVR